MTELQNGAIGYPSTAWQMVWERSKTMRLICMKRRVTDLFTDFIFPAKEGGKKPWGQSVIFLAVGTSWTWMLLCILKAASYRFICTYPDFAVMKICLHTCCWSVFQSTYLPTIIHTSFSFVLQFTTEQLSYMSYHLLLNVALTYLINE